VVAYQEWSKVAAFNVFVGSTQKRQYLKKKMLLYNTVKVILHVEEKRVNQCGVEDM
jgi:hypothetical protein